MKISTPRRRKAISPILATVILIAITLIAAIAIAGFVFGLFGSFTSTPRIQETFAQVTHPAGGGAGLTAVCAAGDLPAANTVIFSNTGSASGAITEISITYSGVTQSAAVAACTVASGAFATITLSLFTTAGVAGQTFTGAAVTSSGAQVAYTGVFS